MKTSEMLNRSLSFEQLELTMQQKGLLKTKAFVINLRQAQRYHKQGVVYGTQVENEFLIDQSIRAEQHANYYRWQALLYAQFEAKTGLDLVDGYYGFMQRLFNQYGSFHGASVGEMKIVIIMLENQDLRLQQIKNRSLPYDKI